ncbi:MAG: hypothetical protein ACTS27_03395 [Phycisphaerales bacterium]
MYITAFALSSNASHGTGCEPVGKRCLGCGQGPNLALGIVTGLCPSDPSGIGIPKDCVKYRMPDDFCFDPEDCDAALCCPDDSQGYFMCNQKPLPGSAPIDCVELKCAYSCCPFTPFLAIFNLDCDGDGVFDQTYGAYGCWF